MNKDKKSRSRIQGGWAVHTPTNKNNHSNDSNLNNSKPKNDLLYLQKEVFKDPKFIQLESTPLNEQNIQVIKDNGDHIISEDCGRTSKLKIVKGFIHPTEANSYFEMLMHGGIVNWRQLEVTRNSETYLQPRLTCWFGPVRYSYSSVSHDANNDWPVELLNIKAIVEQNLDTNFNSLLCNLYRDGHDHVPWHCDDEEIYGPCPCIASVSFGATRLFELRKKPAAIASSFKEECHFSDLVKVYLDSGDLLVMSGYANTDWEHRIAREYHDRGSRINLTFRQAIKSAEINISN